MLQAIGHLTLRQAAQAWHCWQQYVERRRAKHLVSLPHCLIVWN